MLEAESEGATCDEMKNQVRDKEEECRLEGMDAMNALCVYRDQEKDACNKFSDYAQVYHDVKRREEARAKQWEELSLVICIFKHFNSTLNFARDVCFPPNYNEYS